MAATANGHGGHGKRKTHAGVVSAAGGGRQVLNLLGPEVHVGDQVLVSVGVGPNEYGWHIAVTSDCSVIKRGRERWLVEGLVIRTNDRWVRSLDPREARLVLSQVLQLGEPLLCGLITDAVRSVGTVRQIRLLCSHRWA